jgi:hypothetical protein
MCGDETTRSTQKEDQQEAEYTKEVLGINPCYLFAYRKRGK